MTYTKKQVLPALHKSNKVTNPDMPSVEDKNYTATILKYANLALPFPQLATDAKTVVAAINELYAHPGGSVVIPNPPIGEGGIELEQGGYIELEQGGVLDTEQGGGGTVVGPLNAISIDGDIYTIEGSGGTTVVANPSESATEQLYSIQVDSTVYSIPQGTKVSSTNKTLSTSDWNSSTRQQSVTVVGISSSSTIWVAPLSDTTSNYDNYTKAGIRAISQSSNRITFICNSIPSSNVSVNICYC